MAGQLRFSQVGQADDPPAPSDQAFGVRQGNQDVLWTWAQVKAAVAPLATATTPGLVQPDGITTFISGGVISAPASGAGVTLRSVTVTEAEFAAINTNPILVVPAPGPDQAIAVISTFYSIVSGSGVYTSDGTGALCYGTVGGVAADLGDGGLPAAAASENKSTASPSTLTQGILNVDNDGLAGLPVVYAGASPYLGGDLNMTITVLYYTVPCVPGAL